MTLIKEDDWGFEHIRCVDAARADRLGAAGSAVDLIDGLVTAITAANRNDHLRVAVDSKRNEFVECRTIIQFPVNPSLYDWFFNARTGYRAQFWLSPDTGTRFNHQIVERLREKLSSALPTSIPVRKIEVHAVGGSREEKDVGTIKKSRDEVLSTLVPSEAKIWICESRYGTDGAQPEPIGYSVLSDAARTLAKLAIPRWAEAVHPKTREKGEGLRAPSPEAGYSWLDLKGGFLGTDGRVMQIKPQDARADKIHRYGWT